MRLNGAWGLAMSSSNAIERRHLDHVPVEDAHGKTWRQAPFWFLGNFHPVTVALAFLGPVVGLNGLWTSLSAIAGILFGAIFMAAHAAQGPWLGLPQMIQSRAQFGYRGVIVPVFATTFTFVGFNVVMLVIIKQGLFEILGWNMTLVALVASLAAAGLAIYGHDWIHKVALAVFLLSLPWWLILTVGILTGRAGGHGPLSGGLNVAGFFAVFTVAASYNITYAPCVADYSRYLPRETSRRRLTWAVFVGAVGAPIWLIPIGAWMATRLGGSDALTGIYLAGNSTLNHMGTVLTLVAVAALVTTMGISAYSGMLSVLTIVDSVHPVRSGPKARVITIVALAVVWFILGAVLTNATSVLNDALLLMLYLLAPWTSVNLMDFYFVRRGEYVTAAFYTPTGIYGSWGINGIVAYFVGIAAEIPFLSIGNLYQSPGATWLGGVDISWMVGLVVAGGLYVFMTRRFDTRRHAVVAERSVRLLRADVDQD